MCAASAIGVDDDFAPCQPSVAVRAADDEVAGGVHQVAYVVVEEAQHLVAMYLLFDAWDEYVAHIGGYLLLHALFVVVEGVVLCRHHDGVDALWHALVAIFYCHLALGIGAQIGHLPAFFAYVGQCAHDEVGQVERGGHVVFRLVDGIAEHHALVAGTLLHTVGIAVAGFTFAVYATADVLALFVDGREDAAAGSVKLIFRPRVAYLVDGVACYGGQVDVGFRLHFAHDDYLSGSDKRFNGSACLRVIGEKLVEQRIADLVGYLVGVTLAHRLGGEEI